MADGTIEIETKIQEKGITDSVNRIKDSIKQLGNGSLVKGIGNLGVAFNGVSGAIKTAIGVVKSAKAAIDDLTETYKVQAQAETQLEQAAKNNPYLLSSSVRELKRYASELQSISTYSDEQLLPMMAQLASSGRTQAEIMDIMSASMDVAASGVMSLESATKYLNSSFSGLTGELGERIPQVKTLTSEELKQGKAVKLVANQYKGMAREVAKATGTSQQLKNAVGDLKEELGAPFEKALSPVRAFFTELIGGWADAIKKRREYNESEERIKNRQGTLADYDRKVEEAKARIMGARQEIEAIYKTIEDGAADLETYQNLETAKSRIVQLTHELELYTRQREELANAEKKANDMALAEKRAAEEAERNAAAQKAAADAKQRMNDLAINALDAYKKSVDDVEREITAREQLGDYISEREKAEMRYEARRSGYINLITSAQGALSGNLERERLKREEILELARQMAEYDNSPEAKADKYAEEGKGRKETIVVEWKVKKEDLETARAEIKNLQQLLVEDESISVEQRTALEEKYKDAVEEINRQIEEGDKELNERRIQNFADMVDKIGEYTDQVVDIMKNAADLMLETVQNQATAEQAEIELKYRKGEISEDEYNEKITESKRKAAKEQYKIQMVQWAASILQATANVAEGVTKAIAQNGWPLGAVMAGLAAAAGAVQIATIVASKPTPPSFATGGIVPGNSYSGDRVRANVNSGEMILNAAQQRSLWDMANGRGGGGGTSVVINNSAANLVSARPQITEDKIKILIDARVNEGLQKGKYDQSLAMANQGMDGDTWGI